MTFYIRGECGVQLSSGHLQACKAEKWETSSLQKQLKKFPKAWPFSCFWNTIRNQRKFPCIAAWVAITFSSSSLSTKQITYFHFPISLPSSCTYCFHCTLDWYDLANVCKSHWKEVIVRKQQLGSLFIFLPLQTNFAPNSVRLSPRWNHLGKSEIRVKYKPVWLGLISPSICW